MTYPRTIDLVSLADGYQRQLICEDPVGNGGMMINDIGARLKLPSMAYELTFRSIDHEVRVEKFAGKTDVGGGDNMALTKRSWVWHS